jgi:hypothetical protein
MKWIFSALAVFAGCAGSGGSLDLRCAALGAGQYCLQPSSGVRSFEATQMIRLRFKDREETLVAEFEVDASGFRFVGLTPFGQKMIQLDYDNRELRTGALPDARFNPTLLAATLQLAHWPADAVRAGLAAPLRLEESAGVRRVLDGVSPLVSIQFEGEWPPYRRIRMVMHETGLEMEADTLDAAR